jgi:hypothetical protein
MAMGCGAAQELLAAQVVLRSSWCCRGASVAPQKKLPKNKGHGTSDNKKNQKTTDFPSFF